MTYVTDLQPDWRQRKKAATRERIRGSALRLFREQGYDATTVDQIAAAADVTPADFERHFATKDAAIMSVVDDPLQATAAALGDVKADVDPEHALLIATIELLGAIIDLAAAS